MIFLKDMLEKLLDKGSAVIVAEHDPDVMKVADYIVDMGPYAGSEGGRIVYEGSFAGLLKADTLTGTVVFEGTPRELRAAAHSLTSTYL